MNSVTLIGRVTRDIELRKVGENDLTNFTLAVDGSNDITNFIEVSAYGKTAEVLGKFVKKGHQIGVSGVLCQRTYEDKDGNKRSITYVMATNIDLLEKKPVEAEKPAKKSKK